MTRLKKMPVQVPNPLTTRIVPSTGPPITARTIWTNWLGTMAAPVANNVWRSDALGMACTSAKIALVVSSSVENVLCGCTQVSLFTEHWYVSRVWNVLPPLNSLIVALDRTVLRGCFPQIPWRQVISGSRRCSMCHSGRCRGGFCGHRHKRYS